MLEAVYHPSYIPPIIWYKTQLLLWDKIYRIIPYSVEEKFGSAKLASLWDIPEEYFPAISFYMPEKQYFDDRKFAIKQQLLELSKKAKNEYCIEEHFYLNTDKVPKWVGTTLLKLGLRKKRKKYIWGAEHYSVREDASDFLMSCVAHKLSQDRAMSPLTDKILSCFVTYGNQIGAYGGQKPSGESLRSLIAGVFNIMVPDKIEKLNFNDVLEIREEYVDLRRAVNDVIELLSREFRLFEVVEEERANKLINEALKKFEDDVEKFKKMKWRRLFKDWKVQSVATIFGMLAGYIAGGPTASIALGTGAAGISIINHLAGSETPDKIQKTVQYFNEINKKIEMKEFIESLANYRKIVIGEKA